MKKLVINAVLIVLFVVLMIYAVKGIGNVASNMGAIFENDNSDESYDPLEEEDLFDDEIKDTSTTGKTDESVIEDEIDALYDSLDSDTLQIPDHLPDEEPEEETTGSSDESTEVVNIEDLDLDEEFDDFFDDI